MSFNRTEDSKKIDEVAAKLLFETYNHRLAKSWGGKWSDIGGPVKQRWIAEAKAIRAALATATAELK